MACEICLLVILWNVFLEQAIPLMPHVIKHRNYITFASTWISTAHLFSVPCCTFCLVCLRSVSCVLSYVSGLSNPDSTMMFIMSLESNSDSTMMFIMSLESNPDSTMMFIMSLDCLILILR